LFDMNGYAALKGRSSTVAHAFDHTGEQIRQVFPHTVKPVPFAELVFEIS